MTGSFVLHAQRLHAHLERPIKDANDLYVQAGMEDQADALAPGCVSFFSLRVAETGELCLNVFGSGFLTTHRNKVAVVTAVAVAEKLGRTDAYMLTALGAVTINKVVFRLDRQEGLAVGNVDELVRSAAVLPPRTIDPIGEGGRAGANSVLMLGYPSISNVFRKSRRIGAAGPQALSAPYFSGNTIATTVRQPILIEWDRAITVGGHNDAGKAEKPDPRAMLGAPVFDVILDEREQFHTRLMGVAVQYRVELHRIIAARASTLTELLELAVSRAVRPRSTERVNA